MDKDHNINLKVENKEVAQFTTPAKIQEWVRAVMSVLGMIVSVIIVGVIVAVIAFMVWAYYQDSQVQPQKTQKPAKLQQAKPSAAAPVSPSVAQKPAVDLAPWRQLSKNQSPDQVRGFLGEPLRVQGGNFTIWSFPNNGSVTFYENKVYMWTEPQ